MYVYGLECEDNHINMQIYVSEKRHALQPLFVCSKRTDGLPCHRHLIILQLPLLLNRLLHDDYMSFFIRCEAHLSSTQLRAVGAHLPPRAALGNYSFLSLTGRRLS